MTSLFEIEKEELENKMDTFDGTLKELYILIKTNYNFRTIQKHRGRLKKYNMSKFQSTKLFDGFSTVFRQWKAEGTHCRFLHGYGVSFRVWFEGELDERNWVWDFGGMKRAKGTIDGMNPKAWMDYMFDHTLIVAEDDPGISGFKVMDNLGIAQVRILPTVGAEQFAKYVFEKLNTFVQEETSNRVKVVRVEFMENNKNSATYEL
jgi:6-pyruvoyltetrahydropterin/6-carboxytetrahydropterin synthase